MKSRYRPVMARIQWRRIVVALLLVFFVIYLVSLATTITTTSTSQDKDSQHPYQMMPYEAAEVVVEQLGQEKVMRNQQGEPLEESQRTSSHELNSRQRVAKIHINAKVIPRKSDLDMPQFQRSTATLPPRQFHYLGMPKSRICTDKTFLVIGVCSDVKRYDLRQAIRRTWASDSQKLKVLVVFVIGKQEDGTDRELQAGLLDEATAYGDIIHLDHIDNTRTLSIKTLGFLSWIEMYCKQTRFVMKTDDDIFINMKNLVRMLFTVDEPQRSIIGYKIEGALPISDKNSKWHASGFTADNISGKTHYPDYLSGSAYIMPNDLVSDIISASRTVPAFWLEDIYITGMVAKAAAISLVHDERFVIHKQRGFGSCNYMAAFVVHSVMSHDLDQIHQFIQHGNPLTCPHSSYSHGAVVKPNTINY